MCGLDYVPEGGTLQDLESVLESFLESELILANQIH